MPSMSDFGKRSGMDLDDEPKAKEVKVPYNSVDVSKTLRQVHYHPQLIIFLLFPFNALPLETKNVGWTEKARQG